MINFEYYNPAKIIFGKGVENGVGREVAKYGKRVLLHYGGGSIKRNGLYDRVVTSLKAEGLYVAEVFADQGPTLKRYRPRAQGRAYRIRKRTSHVTIILDQKQ